MMFYAENDVLIIIPPLTRQLLKLFDTVNPSGEIGYAWNVQNVGVWDLANPLGGPHSWGILDVPKYFEWLSQVPPLNRYPQTFEFVTHRDAPSSYLNVVRSVALDLSRVRCALVKTPGSEGWAFTREVRITRLDINVAKTELSTFAYGPGTPLHVTTTTNYSVVLRNLPSVPNGATGTNVGTVTIPAPEYPSDPNSIKIQPTGAGAMSISIT